MAAQSVKGVQPRPSNSPKRAKRSPGQVRLPLSRGAGAQAEASPPRSSTAWLVSAAHSEKLFSPTAKISNSKLHSKQWRRRLLLTTRNSTGSAQD